MLVTTMIVFYLRGQTAYSLTANHLTGPRYDEHRGEFIKIFESFEAP